MLANQFSPDNDFTAADIRKEIKKCVKWNCPTCNGTYSKSVCEREVGDDSCPYCKNEQLLYGFNGVAQTESDAITEWVDTDIDTNGIMSTSNFRVDWACNVCGGIYREAVNKHVRDYHDNIHDCPYCNNRNPLAGFNTLDTVIKDVDKLWSSNNDKTIKEVLPNNYYTAEWKCRICGGMYNERVR